MDLHTYLRKNQHCLYWFVYPILCNQWYYYRFGRIYTVCKLISTYCVALYTFIIYPVIIHPFYYLSTFHAFRTLQFQLLTKIRGRDLDLSAPVAPERNYRKSYNTSWKSEVSFTGARRARAKKRDLDETWPRLQFVGARSSKAMRPRLQRGWPR